MTWDSVFVGMSREDYLLLKIEKLSRAVDVSSEVLDQVIGELEDLQAKVKEDFERDAC